MLDIRKSRVRPLQNSTALLCGSLNVPICSPHCKASLLRAFIFTIFQGLLVWACSYFYATARIHLSVYSYSQRLQCLVEDFMFEPHCEVQSLRVFILSTHFKASLLSVYIVLLHCRSRIFGSTHIITPSQGLFVQTIHIFTPFKGLILFPTEVTMQTFGRYYSH